MSSALVRTGRSFTPPERDAPFLSVGPRSTTPRKTTRGVTWLESQATTPTSLKVATSNYQAVDPTDKPLSV